MKRGENLEPQTVDLDFPDSRIGASLKLRGLQLELLSGPHFPDSRIGASLKHLSPFLIRTRRIPLPRFANRGLIEAR